ncbi:MAG: xanthine dehydrogenase molybdopterin binding subunit [Arenicellales bacterium]|jgi:xanthine dehydrogenase large subunit|nr:xanthine dehydrogenase molybdopterin binding subunit [Arenicellales bacterium]MDP7192828.1 xanthine dehydrogenase molybdopterin binding subunit [Arenicellales bacterium]
MSDSASILGAALNHDSAIKHTTGEALYIDDIPEPRGTLHLVPGYANAVCGQLRSVDLSAVESATNVVAVLCADDVPGTLDISPTHAGDDPLLAKDRIRYFGEPVFAVVARGYQDARRASRLAKIDIDSQDPILTVENALNAQSFVSESRQIQRNDWQGAIEQAPHRLRGTTVSGSQDHFYLEGQVSLAIPQEDGGVHIYASTQHPSEIQHAAAQVLGLPDHTVTVEVRRMGGGFGGKESQAAQWAVLAALAATKTGQPVKCRLDRDLDMIMTGKRHDFHSDWEVGYDPDGRIAGVDIHMASRCGCSHDLSDPVNDRAMFHADNAYFYPAVRIRSDRCQTNTVSNTAFRGFGGPQGMLIAEQIIQAIAHERRLDPLDVRRLNFYEHNDRNLTPYHMQVEDFVLDELVEQLESTSRYRERRKSIKAFNSTNPYLRRGLALTPVKFGISFTNTPLNQAGALLHVYKDGSVLLNHGGTEMGQGLLIKVAQVVAAELQIDIDQVQISSTHTGKVPNTSATAASSGTDLNGMAAQNAARTIRRRLTAFAATHYDVAENEIEFQHGQVRIADSSMTFSELVLEAYLHRVQLSATGFYRTPKIWWDAETARGRPFYYFAYGAAVSEVVVDLLTGENRVVAVDILHDVGNSLNPAVDAGQIEGGFIQGMGWLTTEEVWWDGDGRLMTHAPSTYKIPVCSDRPAHFRLDMYTGSENIEATVYRSKAVGEPPLMLALSVHQAIADALSSISDHGELPQLRAPATPEAVLDAIQSLRPS